MAAFVVAPLLLAGVFASGAYALSKTTYPGDGAGETIARRANNAMALCKKGITSENAARQVQFEIDVLKSMMVNVPEVSRDQVQRSISALDEELKQQMHVYHSKKLLSESRAINDELAGNLTREELSKLRVRLEAVQRDMNNVRPSDRVQASTAVTSLFTQLDHVEQIHGDRETLEDIQRSLGLSNTAKDNAQKQGLVYDIIGRFERSSVATKQDKINAAKLSERIEAMIKAPDDVPGANMNDVSRLENLLNSQRIWTKAEAATAEGYMKAMSTQSVSDASKVKGQYEKRIAEIQALTVPPPPNDIPAETFRTARNMADKLVGELATMRQTGGTETVSTQASKLLSYVELIDVKRCKFCSETDGQNIAALANRLRTDMGARATAPTPSGPNAKFSGIADQVRELERRVKASEMLVNARTQIESLLSTQTDLTHKTKLTSILAELDGKRNIITTKRARFNYVKTSQFNGMVPKQNNGSNNTYSKEELKLELQDIGNLPNPQDNQTRQAMIANCG